MSVPPNETTAPEDCPRCSAGKFTWLPCTCLVFCRKAVNCTGVKIARREEEAMARREPVRVTDFPGPVRRVLEAADTGTFSSPGVRLVRVTVLGRRNAVHGTISLPETELRDFCRQVLEAYPEPTEEDIARERRQRVVAPGSPRRCKTGMIHPDSTGSRCVLDKDHLLDDTDHLDIHGHTAPVLVHQSTIREVAAIAAMRERGEIE